MRKKNKIPKLSLHIEYNGHGVISWKELIDYKNNDWGEYVDYWSNGNIQFRGFNRDDKQIGLWTHYNEDGSFKNNVYFSIINPGKEIYESEYKKQLVMIRFGLLEVPELDILIKDYEK